MSSRTNFGRCEELTKEGKKCGQSANITNRCYDHPSIMPEILKDPHARQSFYNIFTSDQKKRGDEVCYVISLEIFANIISDNSIQYKPEEDKKLMNDHRNMKVCLIGSNNEYIKIDRLLYEKSRMKNPKYKFEEKIRALEANILINKLFPTGNKFRHHLKKIYKRASNANVQDTSDRSSFSASSSSDSNNEVDEMSRQIKITKNTKGKNITERRKHKGTGNSTEYKRRFSKNHK